MRRLIKVYLSLIALTLISAFVSEMKIGIAWIPIALILALACVKFITVVLEYMEMHKSNTTWKFSVIIPVLVTSLIIGIFAVV